MPASMAKTSSKAAIRAGLVAALASHEVNWKETIGLIVVLLILSYLLFVKGLELQFPVWPTFLTA